MEPDAFEALRDRLVHRLAGDAAEHFSMSGVPGVPNHHDEIRGRLLQQLPQIAERPRSVNRRRYLGAVPVSDPATGAWETRLCALHRVALKDHVEKFVQEFESLDPARQRARIAEVREAATCFFVDRLDRALEDAVEPETAMRDLIGEVHDFEVMLQDLAPRVGLARSVQIAFWNLVRDTGRGAGLQVPDRIAHWQLVGASGSSTESAKDRVGVEPAMSEGDAVRTESALAAKRQGVIMPILRQKRWSRGMWVTKSGVGKNCVYEYLAGKRNPGDVNRKAMAEALGLAVEDLPE
jgi:hypothetical protein